MAVGTVGQLMALRQRDQQDGERIQGAQSAEVTEESVLRESVRALVGLAYRTPGFDLQVSGGGPRAVRLRRTGGGLTAQLVGNGGALTGEPVELSPSAPAFDAELAALLR